MSAGMEKKEVLLDQVHTMAKKNFSLRKTIARTIQLWIATCCSIEMSCLECLEMWERRYEANDNFLDNLDIPTLLEKCGIRIPVSSVVKDDIETCSQGKHG